MSGETVPSFRSPLYEALNARRYQRQDLIRQIEDQTSRRLAVYFANTANYGSDVAPGDIAPFQDILFDCDQGCDLDLLLQSAGGDIDSAEKIVFMIREKVKGLRILVVERAKSAATLMALAADEILMSSTSELGPIDPQVTVFGADGRPLSRPAHSFLNGLEEIKKSVTREGSLNPAYYPLLSQLDPALLDFCAKAISRAEQFAEKWLTKYMLAGDVEKAKDIARRLTNVEQYRSHGMVIDWREAQEMGLNVSFVTADNPLWRELWRLHLAYQIECNQANHAKIFETRRISIPFF